MIQTTETLKPQKLTYVHLLYAVASLAALSPWINSGEGLLLGVFLALVFGNPFLELSKRLTHRFLGLSVIGLGAGMNLGVIEKVGFQGIAYTVVGISSAILLGIFLGKN